MKEFFYTKEEADEKFDEINQKFSSLLSAVDTFMKRSEVYHQEMVAMGYRVGMHEKWIVKAAQKVDSEYKP